MHEIAELQRNCRKSLRKFSCIYSFRGGVATTTHELLLRVGYNISSLQIEVQQPKQAVWRRQIVYPTRIGLRINSNRDRKRSQYLLTVTSFNRVTPSSQATMTATLALLRQPLELVKCVCVCVCIQYVPWHISRLRDMMHLSFILLIMYRLLQPIIRFVTSGIVEYNSTLDKKKRHVIEMGNREMCSLSVWEKIISIFLTFLVAYQVSMSKLSIGINKWFVSGWFMEVCILYRPKWHINK